MNTKKNNQVFLKSFMASTELICSNDINLIGLITELVPNYRCTNRYSSLTL